jgi:hypothetical protein
MKQKLKKIWEWDGIDYLIQIAGILLFASAFLHFQGANQTLDSDGCSVYWEEYKDVNQSEVLFLNSSEKADLRERETPEPGKYRANNHSLNFTG